MNFCRLFTLIFSASCLPSLAASANADLEALMIRSNGVVSLWEAAEHGDESTLRNRLREGDNPNASDDLGNTPLHVAARRSHIGSAAELLAQGADATLRDAQGRTPAQITGNEEIRSMCLQAEQKRLAELELVQALEEKDGSRACRMLEQGVNPNAKTKDNLASALMKAAANGMDEAVALLLQKGADVGYISPEKETVLHAAASGGTPRIVHLLLEAGADPLAQKGNGATPLHDAVWNGKDELVQALLPALKSVGYNPDGGFNGRPVELAIQRGRTAIVRMILAAGLDVNSPDFKTPLLIQAVQQGDAEMVKALLEAGARRDAANEQGKTARDYASPALAPLLN